MGDSSSDTLRVLVATDCHLGYLEKDEVRRHDSFQAFDEICSIAEQKKVDFVLLGGDLFHENKPSRSTQVKAIEILRQHCLSDKPVQFQVVSDQTVNFANMFSHANYEDPHFNVGLPVFSIHGNHDDPAGVDNLSAVDILSTCNLINYFGKMILGGSGVGQISLSPILIRKGETSVALYGLGNIRDERLNRMFQTPHAVQWIRPESREGLQLSDSFNILVLHQNRVKVNPKNAIHEHMLPEFLDFIVWGHENECLVDPQEVLGKGFHITQPGSSVATSLIDGESKPKHVLLLEIKGNQYRPTKIPLASVRPFEYAEVVLKDEPEIDPNDQNSVLERLDDVVRRLIDKSRSNGGNRSEVKLPLVRIKVDYSGFMTINPQKFGQKYVGKVANPQDILIFTKASKKGRSEGKFDESERLRPEELNQQNIEALVAESNLKTKILPINDLDVALHEFVKKYDKTAFESCVLHNLDETRFEMHGTTSMCWVGRDFVILAADSRSSFGPSLGYESNSPFLEGQLVSECSLKILPLTRQIAFASAGSVQEFNVSQKYLLDHMEDETKTGQDKDAVEKLADLCLGRILVHADNSYSHLFGGVIDKVPKCWFVRNHKNGKKRNEEVKSCTVIGSGAHIIVKNLKDAHAEYAATALVEETAVMMRYLLLIAAFNDPYTGGILTVCTIEAKETPDEILKETPQPFTTNTVLESMIQFYETRLMRMKSFKDEEGRFVFLFYKRGEIKKTELESWLRKKKKKVTFIGHPLMELANNYYAHRVEFETIEAANKFFGYGTFNPPKFEIPFTSEIELRFYELGGTPKHVVLVAPQSLTMLKALNPSQNMKKKILHPDAPLSTAH